MKIMTVSDMLTAMPNIVGVEPPDGSCVFLAVDTVTQTVKVSGVVGGDAAESEDTVQECAKEFTQVLSKMHQVGIDPDECVFVVAFWHMAVQERPKWYQIFDAATHAHFYALSGSQWFLACPQDCPMWDDDEPVGGMLMPPDPELDTVMLPPLPHDISSLIEEAEIENHVLATVRSLPIESKRGSMGALIAGMIAAPEPEMAPYDAAILERLMAEADWWSDLEFLALASATIQTLGEANRRKVRNHMLAMVPYLRDNTALTMACLLMWLGGGGRSHVAEILDTRCLATTMSLLLDRFMARNTPDEVMSGFLAAMGIDHD